MSTSDVVAIRRQMDVISENLIRRDPEAIIPAYALDDMRFSAFEDYPLPFKLMRANEFRDVLKSIVGLEEMSIKKERVEVNIFGDVGIATGYEKWSMKEKSHDSLEGRLRFTMVFLKKGSEWRVIHEHYTKVA